MRGPWALAWVLASFHTSRIGRKHGGGAAGQGVQRAGNKKIVWLLTQKGQVRGDLRIYPGEHGNPGRAAGLSYQRIADTLWQRGIRISHMTVKNVLDGKIKRA